METDVKLPHPWQRSTNQFTRQCYTRGPYFYGAWDVRRFTDHRRVTSWLPVGPRMDEHEAVAEHPKFDDLLTAIQWVELEISNSSA